MSTDPQDQEPDPLLELELLKADRKKLEDKKKAQVTEIDADIDAVNERIKQIYFEYIERADVPPQNLRKILSGNTRWSEVATKILMEAENPLLVRKLVEFVQNSGYPHVTMNMVSTWLTRMKDKGKVERRVFTRRSTGKKIGKWEWVMNEDD